MRNCKSFCVLIRSALTYSRLLLDTMVHPSGILDIRFNNPKCQETEKFAVASSTGSISICKLEGTLITGPDAGMGKIVHLNTFQPFPESIVVTSLAWHSSPNGPIAVSKSNGQVSILNFRDDYKVLHEHVVVNSHGKNEAWTVAFAMDTESLRPGSDPYSGRQLPIWRLIQTDFQPFLSPYQGVYSGGDDSRLRFAKFLRNALGHTVRQASNKRHGGKNGLPGHNAGVTAILPLPFATYIGEDILITGSYDDHVRVYAMSDHRVTAEDDKARVLAELNVGGGVWRLTFLEDYTKENRYGHDIMYLERESQVNTYRVLASCMQGGVRLLEVTGCLKGEWTIKIIADLKFNTANDLVYAGDVQPAGPPTPSLHLINNDDGEEYVCVSANFYEKQLCVWKYDKPATPLSPKTSYLRNRAAMFGPDVTTQGESHGSGYE